MQGSIHDEAMKKACEELAKLIVARGFGNRELMRISNSICKKYGLRSLPSKSMILSCLNEEERERFKKALRVKPVRTASGIAVIAVMSRPYPCPHGACIYCPGGYRYSTPQSYTGEEPAALRGKQNDFDAFKQVSARLDQLKAIGHDVGKAEIIIMGGTFLCQPKEYQQEFIKGCYDAMNGIESKDMEDAKRRAEESKIRNVGMTLETRPDFCRAEHIDLMLDYGVTRVEIGVQTLDDSIYDLVKRGHSVKDVVDAFRTAKDSSLKVVAHMMPGLPSSSPERDFDDFCRLFNDPDFKPDMLKVYPTLVVESSELYKWYLDGKYKPYDDDTVIELLARVKSMVPRWLRIMRIQRDIPARLIVAGVKKSNLRELVQRELSKMGEKCQCIRCREVGLKQLKYEISIKPEDIRLSRQTYEASGGIETFLSYEDGASDALIGFLRLRYPSERAHRRDIDSKTCLVRELHVYGTTVPIGKKYDDGYQHRGYGARLMKEAERLAREDFDARKMIVMSAIGTKEYYKRLGYTKEGPYMAKIIG
ncbi:MAG: tRNA uridine(34) 5-carboxymethylaminomethyl modification radical SAM/GNAT enzyme Elp3 [Nitrososphaerales archaeon]